MSVPPRLQPLVEQSAVRVGTAPDYRHNVWHVLKIPLFVILMPAFWYHLGVMAWRVAQAWHPDLQAIAYLGADF